MLAIVISNLERVNNDISKEVVDTYFGKKSTRKDYQNTIYRDFTTYIKKMSMFNGWLKGRFQKDLADTNLIFTKTNQPVNFSSKQDQGIGFGFTLVDYVTKRPMIINYVDDQNKLKTSIFNKTTGEYVNTEKTIQAATPDELGNKIMDEVKTQINSFK